MRIPVKGGVWKNTEDEILKAAVMKYGKNQWARISSLLVRKSAKQCKARWYEWIDPSIKKTEWSREEEEKLLHLAKLMPTQWRTIAPIVGRTAAQCLEHYEKLLDAAQGKDASYDAADDPRRLRPGEIDPQPETKPARPDPVDMDEDEKEMLSEARARLANTKGKKAKRKARERQLDEARRIAALQKRRELKAAGINYKLNPKRKIKGIDYSIEIPFQKMPAPGFYDTSEEKHKQKEPVFRSTTLGRLEGKKKGDQEAEAKRKDIRKHRIQAEKDLPAMLNQINKMNEAESSRKRSRLALPEPQLSEADLEELAKMEASGIEELIEDGETKKPTKALVGTYSATPTPHNPVTTMRTPARTPAREDTVMREAQNLIALTQTASTLMGGDNAPLVGQSDFSGATPANREVQTPNILATPLRGSKQGVPSGTTPRKGANAPGMTPLRTPLRDQLHINEEDRFGGESEREERHRQNQQLRQVKEGLSLLPAPKNKFKVVLPEAIEDDQENEESFEEDSADIEAKQRAAQAAEGLFFFVF